MLQLDRGPKPLPQGCSACVCPCHEQGVGSQSGLVIDDFTLTKPAGWQPNPAATLSFINQGFQSNYTETYIEARAPPGPCHVCQLLSLTLSCVTQRPTSRCAPLLGPAMHASRFAGPRAEAPLHFVAWRCRRPRLPTGVCELNCRASVHIIATICMGMQNVRRPVWACGGKARCTPSGTYG